MKQIALSVVLLGSGGFTGCMTAAKDPSQVGPWEGLFRHPTSYEKFNDQLRAEGARVGEEISGIEAENAQLAAAFKRLNELVEDASRNKRMSDRALELRTKRDALLAEHEAIQADQSAIRAEKEARVRELEAEINDLIGSEESPPPAVF